MKIAVGLFGIHYVERLNHWANWVTSVDYRKTYQNNIDNIYSCFPNAVIDYFSATYDSPIKLQLEQDYKFCKIRYNQLDNTFPTGDELFVRRNRIFKQTLELILGSPNIYDFALITRYDMNMMVEITSLPFDLDKINVFYKAKWGSEHNLCDDNFYFMTYDTLKDFYNQICNIPETVSSHRWNQHLSNLHFMVPGAFYSHESSVYHIHREILENRNN